MIFLSYSRKDESVVTALNHVIVAAGTDTFQDVSIPAGSDWRAFITRNLNQCERMFVFWCRHSSRSREVEKEYLFAIDRKKRVVPIMLDGTTLPPALSRCQALNNPMYRRLHFLDRAVRVGRWLGPILLVASGFLAAFQLL